MFNKLRITFIIYLAVFICLVGSVLQLLMSVQNTPIVTQKKSSADFVQPPLQQGVYPWSIRSIDTQVISKHWPNVTRSTIKEQVLLLKNLGVNYIAIGTPYDRVAEFRMWAEEIHLAGLNVWYRSHWAEWEGDDGKSATLTPDEYLYRTKQFIENNADIFKPGDAFTACVEAEQVGVGLGKRFLTWDHYREFLTSQIVVSNQAFETIGLKGKIYTNWLSVNGWIVENQFTQDLVDKLGIVVVDHFVGQSKTIGDLSDAESVVEQTIIDLDRFYEKWKKPIFLGEWGYQIFQNAPDELQAKVVHEMLTQLATKDYIVGMNYWVHMGNSASLLSDQYGSNLQYREAAYILKSFYDPVGPSTVSVTPTRRPIPSKN